MKKRTLTTIIASCICLTLFGMNSMAQSDMNQQDMQEFMKAMGAMMGSGGDNTSKVVNFRDIKKFLPKDIDGMKRTSAGGEKSGAMGMTVSYADASYETDNGGHIDLKISDMSGSGGLGGMMMAGWGAMEIDRETETDFERTVQYGDYKAQEKYETPDKSGDITIMVERFMIEASGNNVPFENIQAVVKAIDLTKLAELKPETENNQ